MRAYFQDLPASWKKIPRYLIWKVLNQSYLCAHIFRICVPRVHQTFANIFRICLPRDKPIPVHAHIFRICVPRNKTLPVQCTSHLCAYFRIYLPRNKTLPVHHTCAHISGFTCHVTKPYLYITLVRIFQDLPAAWRIPTCTSQWMRSCWTAGYIPSYRTGKDYCIKIIN